MRRTCVPLIGVVVGVLLAGCGPAAPSGPARAAAIARAGLARRLPAIGRPVTLSARCHGASCSLTYDYTPPDGYRRQYLATVPASCAHTCSIRWAAFKVRRIMRKFGLDPDYPVGQCAHAVDKALHSATLVNLARDPAVEVACAGVHKSVYTGPLLTAPG